MKLITFAADGEGRIGALVDGWALDFHRARRPLGLKRLPEARSLRALLAADEAILQRIREALQEIHLRREPLDQGGPLAGALYPLDAVKLRAPITDPQKIIGIGLNYRDHCEEQGAESPERPILFAKFPSSIIGPEEPISWPSELTDQVDCEAELAVVIGRPAKHVSAERSLEYVAGYTILNDVSARDLQFGDRQWTRGKSLDTFCPMGPYLATLDELPDPQRLAIRCRVNGETMQDSSTDRMIFSIPELIAFISQGITLVPGDVIATGTPAGVGVFRAPPRFLQPGDVVEIAIEGLGVLRNPVAGAVG